MDKRLELISELTKQQADVIDLAIDLITTCTNPTDYDKLKLLRFSSEIHKLNSIMSRIHNAVNDIKEKESNNE